MTDKWDAYFELTAHVPMYDNPVFPKATLDDRQYSEVMVTCICGTKYRLLVEGKPPVSYDPKLVVGVACRNCHASVETGGVIWATHSAGVFNASMTIRRT